MWRNSVGWGLVASLALHGAWFGSLYSVPAPAVMDVPVAPHVTEEVAFEAITMSAETTATRTTVPEEITPGGARSLNALDVDQRSGRGGDGRSEDAPALLFSFASALTLQDTELNNLAANQTQRIETGPLRATQEERRASPNAADAVFLASGSGEHRERRVPTLHDAQRGALHAAQTASRMVQATSPKHEDGAARTEQVAAAKEQVALGIQRGSGRRTQKSARVAHARPNVDRGPAATPAEAIDARLSTRARSVHRRVPRERAGSSNPTAKRWA
jgi:hypothetical protein